MTVAVYAGCVGPDPLRISVELRDRRNKGTISKTLSVPVPRGKPDISCWDALMPEVLKALNHDSLDEAKNHYGFSILSDAYVDTNLAAKLGEGSYVFAELSDKGHVTRTFKARYYSTTW